MHKLKELPLRELVLLQKVYRGVPKIKIKESLKELCGELTVELSGLSATENDWVKVTISGEDENVAVRLLEQEVGLAPITAENVVKFSVINGRIISSGQSRREIFVDIGVLSPAFAHAFIPLETLQGQLADGSKFALEQIVDLFGLVDGFPLEIRVVSVGPRDFSAELGEKQLFLYSKWVASQVDRLVVIGALGEQVIKAAKEARLNRFVLRVESLGISEHVVVCKLGTDAIGLVKRLGSWLPGAKFVIFSPRSILEFGGKRW